MGWHWRPLSVMVCGVDPCPLLSLDRTMVVSMWRPGTTAEIRQQHVADLQAWADGIRASLPMVDRELLRESASSDERARAFEVWVAACAAGPPRPVSEFWDDEPVVDFESDPRLSEVDRVRIRALAERGRRRWLEQFGEPE